MIDINDYYAITNILEHYCQTWCKDNNETYNPQYTMYHPTNYAIAKGLGKDLKCYPKMRGDHSLAMFIHETAGEVSPKYLYSTYNEWLKSREDK